MGSYPGQFVADATYNAALYGHERKSQNMELPWYAPMSIKKAYVSTDRLERFCEKGRDGMGWAPSESEYLNMMRELLEFRRKAEDASPIRS